ncbi:hypothetical protein ISN45_Aa05g031260 [Arabidopsis thaliana x Arabidopsis arenosa]|uniref:Fold protein n=1 Tax=Arabidopsis thaliana x Arabidopsis arenosa TaxID=1240361 RepID=A0A8T1ZQM1_9BRAS|nr:hypothetical protein ISN45_Aa05g031260 [Arabidopsis thaliana x Arabidopsis arenosa]
MEMDESLVMVSSLSRLSICTSSAYVNEDESATKNHPDSCVFTSLENFDGAEADGEVSDDGEGKENVRESDSDKETRGFYSLPVTPSRRRRKLTVSGELDANESNRDGGKCSLRRQKKVIREKKKKRGNGESDGGGREGLTVLTRAKGGEKSLRMGLEEVKACRDLGFELEVPVPGRISVSTTGSNFDTQTSSGGNSPIAATWRISSPGDDPKEVKARLKVWAQAVALASATRQAS